LAASPIAHPSPAATSPNEPPPKRLRRTTPPSIWDSGKGYLTFLGIKKDELINVRDELHHQIKL
jgi:hypothetical protein